MSKLHGIIVFGENGSGKTTLGRELARILNFKHMDIEDYYFLESEIPYTYKRSHEDFLQLMLADIEKYRSFVLSAVNGVWDSDGKITLMYDLAVYISAPLELRIKRIEQRE
jgi:cytidylate kinase